MRRMTASANAPRAREVSAAHTRECRPSRGCARPRPAAAARRTRAERDAERGPAAGARARLAARDLHQAGAPPGDAGRRTFGRVSRAARRARRRRAAGALRDASARELARALGSSERFAWIDPMPLGTASIAQVHRARLRDGSAGRGQGAPRRADTGADRARRAQLAARRVPAAAVARSRRRGDELFDELETALLREIDFELEGRVAEAIARDLARRPARASCRACTGTRPRAACSRSTTCRARASTIARRSPRAASRPRPCSRSSPTPTGGRSSVTACSTPIRTRAICTSSTSREPRRACCSSTSDWRERLSPPVREELRLGLQALLKRDVDALLAGLVRLHAVVPGRERAGARGAGGGARRGRRGRARRERRGHPVAEGARQTPGARERRVPRSARAPALGAHARARLQPVGAHRPRRRSDAALPAAPAALRRSGRPQES